MKSPLPENWILCDSIEDVERIIPTWFYVIKREWAQSQSWCGEPAIDSYKKSWPADRLFDHFKQNDDPNWGEKASDFDQQIPAVMVSYAAMKAAANGRYFCFYVGMDR